MNEARPVILVVDNSTAVTGALNAMRGATDPLRARYEFVYVLPAGSKARPVLEQAGYRVYELPFVEIQKRVRSLVLYLPMLLLNGARLARLLRRERAVLLHMNDFYNLTGVLAGGVTGQPVVTHVRFLPHTQMQPLARTWRWVAERFAQRVVCVSQAVRTYFSAAAKVQVVYDPLPAGGEKHAAAAQPQPRPDGTVRLLYLSNYIPGKGQNFALEAFEQAYRQQPNLRLHFAGGDMGLAKNQEFRQQLQARAQAAGLAEVVTFGGFVQDVEQAIKQADILLNFSESESFSLTCLDALYFGTPLIASDCGGPRELFEHGKSGLLVPNRDVAAMTQAIVELAARPEQRGAFAEAGRAYIRAKLTPEATYLALGDVYAQVLARQGRG